MRYDFKCTNEKCSEYNIIKEYEMKVIEYKIPKCEKCGKELQRVYNSFGAKTSDGIKISK